MRAAILAVGDELISGYRLDTNSQAISRRLATIPLDVVQHLTVGDDLRAIQEGLRTALAAAEVVVVTGGLGPTEDDLTRQAVAAFFDRPLVEDAEALARIHERFARRQRPMPERNRIQAQVPAGSQVIQNDWGTAAGFHLQEGEQHVFVVPGVPFEMIGMLEQAVLPPLRELAGSGAHIQRGVLKLFGPTESEVAERIQGMLGRERNPLLGLLPQRGTITVEVVAHAATAEEAEALVEADLATLREAFGQAVLCEDERTLPQVVGDLLADAGLTLAVAEAPDGTGGAVAARLCEADGCSRWLRGARVAATPDTPGAVESLAAAVRREMGTAASLAAGPLACPPDAPPDRPYWAMDVAVDLEGAVASRRLTYPGQRLRVRDFATDAAINLLRLHVLRGRT